MRPVAGFTSSITSRFGGCPPAVLSAALLALAGAACADEAVGPRSVPRAASFARPTLRPTALIAFRTNRDGDDEIYSMRQNGSAQTNLTNNPPGAAPGGDFDFSWSPDGSKIAFWTNRDFNAEIYVMNADGSGQVNLTNNAAEDRYPVWSRDGSKIAFVRGNQLAIPVQLDIYVMDANGANQINVSNHPGFNLEPAFSPDGTKLLFRENADGSSNIMIVDVTGANLQRLTDTPGASNFLGTWSPDGSKIAFVSSRDDLVNGDLQVYLMDPNGANQTRLTTASDNTHPAWSPDGSKIAFTSFRTGDDEIFVMNADGSSQTNLTNNSTNDNAPKWSPDGSKIAFTRRTSQFNIDVFVMNANGSKQTNLTPDSPTSDISPAWRP